MEHHHPFFSDFWNPSRHRYPSPNPVVRQQKKHHQPPPYKVVSIPVRFVGSEKAPSESATKIQSLYRGYSVRKNVKKIAKIRSQVEEIDRRVSRKEDSDLIARDAKERLRLNETLMSLLFQLDSVRGIDPAVRDFRKAVIRRAIALQEAIDAIVEKRRETEEAPVEFAAEKSLEMQNPDGNSPSAADEQKASEIEESTDDCRNLTSSIDDDDLPEKEIYVDSINVEGQTLDESLAEEEDDGAGDETVEKVEVLGSVVDEKEEEEGSGGVVVERVMEENEKLRGLVSELCERNELQSRLVESLSQRVDQLERVIVARCEMVRKTKKKKKRNNAGKMERRMCERRW